MSAVYRAGACPSCEERYTTFVKRVGEGLTSLWRGTKKIEVGVKSVSYEKETGAKSRGGHIAFMGPATAR
jgi:hypothetical protein